MNMSDTDISEDYQGWIVPEFDSINSTQTRKTSSSILPTADDIENIYQEAREEGYEKGYSDGMNAAKNEINKTSGALTSFIKILDEPYKQVTDNVVETIKHLAVIIAGQIIRREINQDENIIIAAINKSIALISEIETPMSVHVHPDDISAVRGYLDNVSGNIKFVDDITISRGGCRIDTSMSIIDATIEAQIKEIAATLIGGSRVEDD